jgi:DNA-binding beta-propeller fold protein YncE
MAKYEDSVYVALYDSKSIGIINTIDHQLVDEIELEMSPTEIRVDKDGMIWVLASEWGIGSTVYKINSSTRSIDGEWQFDESNGIIQLSLSPSGNSVYLLSSIGEVYKFSTLTSSIINPIFTVDHDGLYGLDVDEDGNIYICDAIDYVQNGSVHKYNESGVLLYSITSGISPNGIVFR